MTIELKPATEWSTELSGPPVPPIRLYISDFIHGLADRVRGETQAFPPDPEPPRAVAPDEPHDGPDANPGVHPRDDPATPELRAKLTRKLLIAAIRRYEETLAAAIFMDSAYPVLALPKEPLDEAEKAERRAWRRLVDQFDDDFNNAELALASRIQNLYADLALEGRAVDRAVLGEFHELAVRHQGTTYILVYDVDKYEPGENIIAILRDGVTFDLADVAGDDRR
jgi:hypothetical protein